MPPEEFNPEICELKHNNIDKDIKSIKEDIKEIRNEENEQHEEIKEMIMGLSKEIATSHINLKNKIVLVNKSMGDKIDDLNEFNKKLRGNGDPGIWESIRNIKRNIKIIMCTITVILILVLGGSYRGISLDGIRKRLPGQKIKQVEPISLKGNKLLQVEPVVKVKPVVKIEYDKPPTFLKKR